MDDRLPPGIEAKVIGSVGFACLLPVAHPLIKKPELTLADLAVRFDILPWRHLPWDMRISIAARSINLDFSKEPSEPKVVNADGSRVWSNDVNDKLFAQPIRLKFEPFRERLIRSAWEGLECLSDWPADRGRRHRAAMRACRDALDGWTTAQKARKALISAAREASLLDTLRPRR